MVVARIAKVMTTSSANAIAGHSNRLGACSVLIPVLITDTSFRAVVESGWSEGALNGRSWPGEGTLKRGRRWLGWGSGRSAEEPAPVGLQARKEETRLLGQLGERSEAVVILRLAHTRVRGPRVVYMGAQSPGRDYERPGWRRPRAPRKGGLARLPALEA